MLFNKFEASTVAALSGIIPAFIWWLILTGAQWVINKSGGNGDWVGDYKFYVIAFIWIFVSVFIYIIARRGGNVTR